MNNELIRAAGGVVYTYGPAGELLVLLIQDKYGVWTLPKGHLDPGEDDADAAVREIAEETGIYAQLVQPLSRTQYPVYKRGIWRDKQVVYFLASAAYTTPEPAIDEGITTAEWVAPTLALERMSYAQVREVLRQGLAAIESRQA
jgi:8-oxo-dGTP diphosphatase